MFSKVVIRGIIVVVFCVVFVAIVAYARGYRFNFGQQEVTSTGIIVATSAPDAAKIYLNGSFYGATNSNISLAPGDYHVELKKDGYSTWAKDIKLRGELVMRADGILFPQNPSLSPLTSLGVVKAFYFEKSSKVILLADSDEGRDVPEELAKDGIYLLDNARRQLSIFNPLKLLVAKRLFPNNSKLSDASIIISPDQKEMLLSLSERTYLLSTSDETKDLLDVTNSKQAVLDVWSVKRDANLKKVLETFKKPFPQIVNDNFEIISFSPDETKFLYIAKHTVKIPQILKPALVSRNQSPESRTVQPGHIYVYDKKEDTNYEIAVPNSIAQLVAVASPTPTPRLSPTPTPRSAEATVEQNTSPLNISPSFGARIVWYPDSAHLIMREDSKITVVDYDNTNKQTVYSGPMEQDFLSVTTDGRLLILANLNPQTNKLPDVYAVGIR